MGAAANTGRAKTNSAGIGLGVSDELGNRFRRNRWVHHHDIGASDEARDRRNVADEIEGEFLIKGCVERGRRADQEERIAVGRRAHDSLAADIGAATRPVLNDKWLAEPL